MVAEVTALAPARLNLVASDGHTLVATRWGDTLFTRSGPTGTVVASEPDDDGDDWVEVADRHLVTLGADGLAVRPLP